MKLLTDETYAMLLDKTNGKPISDALRLDILAYYADPEKAFATKKNSEAWQKVLDELISLRAMPAAGTPHALILYFKTLAGPSLGGFVVANFHLAHRSRAILDPSHTFAGFRQTSL
jgi:hypothetical protein